MDWYEKINCYWSAIISGNRRKCLNFNIAKLRPTAAWELIKKQWFAFSNEQKKRGETGGYVRSTGCPLVRTKFERLPRAKCHCDISRNLTHGIEFRPRLRSPNCCRPDGCDSTKYCADKFTSAHSPAHTLTATARLQYFYTLMNPQYHTETHKRAPSKLKPWFRHLSIPDNAEIFYYKIAISTNTMYVISLARLKIW